MHQILSVVKQGLNLKWKKLIRIELCKRDMTYIDLAAKLTYKGYPVSPHSLGSQLSRGKLDASLLLKIFHVLNIRKIDISDTYETGAK